MTDDEESALVTECAKTMGEHFDAVVVLCSRHDGERGTRTISKGSGNWHAQYGIVREWLVDRDEEIKINVRHET